MKRFGLAVLLVSSVALGGAIKTWLPGDVLSVVDLNTALGHIHSTMVGGHGARLKNADVSPVAGISHSKMATPGLLPKSIVHVGVTTATACAASPCTVSTLAGIVPTSVTWVIGVYTVTIPARPNAVYSVHVNSSTGALYCSANTFTTTTFIVNCYNGAGAAANAAFQFTLLDDDN